ncbi:type II toxin-antitoxin system VapC family toxin [Acidisphaera sp. S103]|uniref:type II toxin-antitoxin system VapC family toxin n=1 Tax=Acidisphaera sp. S103 TaxID=1747223 RepID=UPI0020B17506|nr:type II toxin-antitoxin system VapC family toxin [Acidisphaera sp. S103]
MLAIVLREPDGRRYLDAVLDAAPRRMSVSNWLEATMVVDRRGNDLAVTWFEDFMQNAEIELMPVSISQAAIARRAWRVFGRGSHPARLNYGDCFAYALAKETREPLLFKGDDFAQTDIEPALKD